MSPICGPVVHTLNLATAGLMTSWDGATSSSGVFPVDSYNKIIVSTQVTYM